jgi:membrane associated rhomboid family serine protease
MQFNPYSIRHRNELHRFFTYGFLHADWIHLLINMFVLLSFGLSVEKYFSFYFQTKAYLYYILLYVGGIIFSVLYDYGKHKNDSNYNAVGASGAVSAVVFSNILFDPTGRLYLYFIPIGIPAVIFGFLYLIYSAYMARRGSDNVGHNSHFWGAIFGLIFTILLKPKLVIIFLHQISALIGH